MPSRADRARIERALRITAYSALALWIANAARPAIANVAVATEATLPRELEKWTRMATLDSVHAQLDTVPGATSSAWLSALSRAGLGVSWAGPTIPATALEAFPATDPAGGVVVLTSAPATTSRVLSDALGPLDTLSGGASNVRLASLEGDVVLTADKQPARSQVPESRSPRRVFVTGAAGWEAKFVIAALEESGWIVDAHVFVAPDRDVTQGAVGALDTARYAAAVLLDSAGAESVRGVEAFVRSGGGVVLAGDAHRSTRVAGLTTWRAGKREVAPLGTLAGDSAWRGLSRIPLTVPDSSRAVVIERRGNGVELVARRHYAGRVAGVGYDQTWRWRMAGGDGSRVEHREWWSRVVAGVAHRPAARVATRPEPVNPSFDRAFPRPGPKTYGAAPLAHLVDVLGSPAASVRVLPAALSPALLSNVLGAILLAALLAEWLSRRARGAK